MKARVAAHAPIDHDPGGHRFEVHLISDIIHKLLTHPGGYRMCLLRLNAVKLRHDIAVQAHGFRLYTRSIDRLIAAVLWKYSLLGSYETRLMKSYLREGMTALDVGANIGFFSLLMASALGSRGRVVAFEPDPGNYRLLSKNVRENRMPNITTVNAAVANHSGTCRLYRNPAHHGDHRIFHHPAAAGSMTVDMTSLDDYFRGGIRVDFVKMDVQGAEIAALEGMRGVVESNPQIVIVTEYSPGHLVSAGENPARFFTVLDEFRLKAWVIDESAQECRAVTAAFKMNTIADRTNYWNLILLRET